jgi:hypothetical protein
MRYYSVKEVAKNNNFILPPEWAVLKDFKLTGNSTIYAPQTDSVKQWAKQQNKQKRTVLKQLLANVDTFNMSVTAKASVKAELVKQSKPMLRARSINFS